MKKLLSMATLLLASCGNAKYDVPKSLHEFKVKNIEGKEISSTAKLF